MKRIAVFATFFFFIFILFSCSVENQLVEFITAAPSFSHNGGVYNLPIEVTITSSSPSPTVYFTTNGSNPRNSQDVITNNTLWVSNSLTIRAYASNPGHKDSDISEVTYYIDKDAFVTDNPDFSLTAGTYTNSPYLDIHCATEDSVIIVTTNGSDPRFSPDSFETNRIRLTSTMTVRAYAHRDGMVDSEIRESYYTIVNIIETPSYTPVYTEYTNGTILSLNSITEGVLFLYTTDGSNPYDSLTTLTGNSIVLNQQTTNVQIGTYKEGWVGSELIQAPVNMAPGVSMSQFLILSNLAITYNQADYTGLRAAILVAQSEVLNNPSLISDSADRSKFITQDPGDTAGVVCTSIGRWIYLYALDMLYPGYISYMPEFWEFYVKGVDDGLILYSDSSACFCIVYDDETLMNNYLEPSAIDFWRHKRSTLSANGFTPFANDTEAYTIMTNDHSPQIVVFREGNDAYTGTHTYSFVMTVEKKYRMLDQGHSSWVGDPLDFDEADPERYGPTGLKYIHNIAAYVNTDWR